MGRWVWMAVSGQSIGRDGITSIGSAPIGVEPVMGISIREQSHPFILSMRISAANGRRQASKRVNINRRRCLRLYSGIQASAAQDKTLPDSIPTPVAQRTYRATVRHARFDTVVKGVPITLVTLAVSLGNYLRRWIALATWLSCWRAGCQLGSREF